MENGFFDSAFGAAGPNDAVNGAGLAARCNLSPSGALPRRPDCGRAENFTEKDVCR
jgi:hypothetical protein